MYTRGMRESFSVSHNQRFIGRINLNCAKPIGLKHLYKVLNIFLDTILRTCTEHRFCIGLILLTDFSIYTTNFESLLLIFYVEP